MVKSKTKLMKARKEECYNSSNEDSSPEDEIEKYEVEKEIKEEHILNTSILLRERLIQYADDCAYPLCEFLDIENIENYVRWILNN